MTVVVHRLLRIRSERQRAIVATPASRVELDAEQPGSIQAEAERAKQEKEAQMDAILTQTAESALEGREFVNEYTRAHFLGELKKAIQDPANKGKKPADLFADMTKDVDGIFRNPQHEPLKIAGVTKSDTSGNMTKDQIMSIKDASERQAAIAEHLDLFRKD